MGPSGPRAAKGQDTVRRRLALTLSLTVGLPLDRTRWGLLKLGIALPAGLLTTFLFLWIWVAAQQGYNRAVQDAANIGLP
jgi:hypothetical protein